MKPASIALFGLFLLPMAPALAQAPPAWPQAAVCAAHGMVASDEPLASILNWMRLGMEAQAVINAPRFHPQWIPDRVALENSFPAAVEEALRAMGHETSRRGNMGLVNTIRIDARTGQRLGAADHRTNGWAQGY